ncbi:hypothetical protein B0H14DRAFT_2598838 [Mycena olivaceomarginata]|nr:hypothetical protein B0H14DRAFT_2598838 [Mycena olivaceomarginata]
MPWHPTWISYFSCTQTALLPDEDRDAWVNQFYSDCAAAFYLWDHAPIPVGSFFTKGVAEFIRPLSLTRALTSIDLLKEIFSIPPLLIEKLHYLVYKLFTTLTKHSPRAAASSDESDGGRRPSRTITFFRASGAQGRGILGPNTQSWTRASEQLQSKHALAASQATREIDYLSSRKQSLGSNNTIDGHERDVKMVPQSSQGRGNQISV